MQCHYEVLEVSRDASLEDLKKSYRKLVLQWHPDKNLNNAQECKEKFQLIQQAYDILSDPQERAWYDKHRDDILKGGENFKDDSLNVFQYFRTSCYSGFGDDDKGFFTVYRQAFEKIAAEDTPFMDQEELMPNFGNSSSPYEVVHLFYSLWQSYCTAKTYVWIEAYDIRQATNRRMVKLMDRENKKVRDTARKARNEEIRELVAFVRKRDPRVQAERKRLEEKRIENLRKAQIQREKAILERTKELSNYQESEWCNMSKLEAGLEQLEAELDNQFGKDSSSETECETQNGSVDIEDKEEYTEFLLEESGLYCIACEKMFQSERAKMNHDKSKKHRENVALLKEILQEEDNLMTQQEEQNGLNEQDDKEKLHASNADDALHERLHSSGSDSEVKEVKSKSKYSRKKKKKAVVIQDSSSEEEKEGAEEGEAFERPADTSNERETEVAVSSIETKEKKKRRRTKQNKPAETIAPPVVVEDHNSSDSEPQKILCQTCRTKFTSRNKLFNHLKSTRHSVYLEDRSQVAVSEKPAKGRKGRIRQRED